MLQAQPGDGERVCSDCGHVKPNTPEFFQPIRRNGSYKLSVMCRSCRNASAQRWRDNNKPKIAAYTKLDYERNRDKHTARLAKWRAENADVIRNYNCKYYADKKDELLAYRDRYRANNPGRVAEACARWTRQNADKNAAKTAKRRAAEKKATPIDADLKAIEAFYVRAREMTLATGICHHVDHIMPLALGGTHEPCNLRIIPAVENLRKGARPPIPSDYIGA